MPTYIMLSTLTPEGVQTVKNNPQRIREVNHEIEQLGATVKAQWATLGRFDFINVVEAPDTSHDGRTVRVVQAVPGTPASQSGIQPGDTVMRIDTREIYRPGDVLDASFFSHVGGNMTVVVRRDEKLFNYTFAVIERPESSPPPKAALLHPNVSMPPAAKSPGESALSAEPIPVNRFVQDSR